MDEHNFVQKYLLEIIVILIGGLVYMARRLGENIPEEKYATRVEMQDSQTVIMDRIDKRFDDVQHDMDYFRKRIDNLADKV